MQKNKTTTNNQINKNDINFSMKGSFNEKELQLVRWSIAIAVTILLYIVGVCLIDKKITYESTELQNIIEHTKEQIKKAEDDNKQILSDYEDYKNYYELIQTDEIIKNNEGSENEKSVINNFNNDISNSMDVDNN